MTNEDLKRFYPNNSQGPSDFVRYTESGDLPGSGTAIPVLITAANSIAHEGYSIPKLTVEQVVIAYNGFVAGKVVEVVSTNGTEHFLITRADSVSGGVTVTLNYHGYFDVTYEETSSGVDVIFNHLRELRTVGPTTSSMNLLSGHDYYWDSPLTGSHSILLIRNEYDSAPNWALEFITNSSAPTITFPSGVKWVGGAPVLKANKGYTISIKRSISNQDYVGTWGEYEL